jgi:hypothetical protein
MSAGTVLPPIAANEPDLRPASPSLPSGSRPRTLMRAAGVWLVEGLIAVGASYGDGAVFAEAYPRPSWPGRPASL